MAAEKPHFPILEAEMVKHGIGEEILAKHLGITERAFRNKIFGKTDFWWNEVLCIHKIFPDVEPEKLFSHVHRSLMAYRIPETVLRQNIKQFGWLCWVIDVQQSKRLLVQFRKCIVSQSRIIYATVLNIPIQHTETFTAIGEDAFFMYSQKNYIIFDFCAHEKKYML